MRNRTKMNKEENNDSRKRRVCKFGCGVETTYGKCDTPGFRQRESNSIVTDLRGYTRLELKRQSKRILQSSIYALQSWRANCDIQIMLYNTDPTNPDPSELATVTDYVVSYACKGSESVMNEKQKIKSYILSLDQNTENKYNNNISTVSLVTKIINNAMKVKIISAQEATVLLSGLDLCFCSETIETVSLSGSYKLGTTSYSSYIYNKYANRVGSPAMSLDDFFHITKNKGSNKYIIPHYVGARMQAIWPPTKEFAKAMLIIHLPWAKTFHIPDDKLIQTFKALYESSTCPPKMRYTINRELYRWSTKADFREHINMKVINYSDFTMHDTDSTDNDDLIALVSTIPADAANIDDDIKFDYGITFNWDKPKVQLSQQQQQNMEYWIQRNIINVKEDSTTLQLPSRYDGTTYSLEAASDDQAEIIAFILDYIRGCFLLPKLDNRKHIRMTITGVAGSGKSTLIHTLTTAIRKIFNSTQSVKVCAPTGCAASNIFGTTCHHTAHIGMMKPITDDIPQSILKELKKSFHNVVCLIIDERSLMSSKLLARMEYNIRHATNNGRNANFSWGNIPVVLLVGDDYQLPPVEPGAFKIDSITNPKQFETSQGEKLFNEFASVTMSLDKSKRVLSDQIVFSDILSRLRAESDSVSKQECYSPLARLYNRLMRARKWKINKRTLFKWNKRKYYANIV